MEKYTITEIARKYGVSKMSVSNWKLHGEKTGNKILVDVTLPQNRAIIEQKTRKPFSPRKTIAEIENEKTLLEIKRSETDIQKPFSPRKTIAEIENEKMLLEIKRSETDIQKNTLLIKKAELEIRLEEIRTNLELKKLQMETDALAGKYIRDNVVSGMLKNTISDADKMRRMIIEIVQSDKDGSQKIKEINETFTNEMLSITQNWEDAIRC